MKNNFGFYAAKTCTPFPANSDDSILRNTEVISPLILSGNWTELVLIIVLLELMPALAFRRLVNSQDCGARQFPRPVRQAIAS